MSLAKSTIWSSNSFVSSITSSFLRSSFFSQTRDLIDAYCERFERDMLKLFDKFYRRSDPRTMAHIAKVLTSFNGGQSSVQIYVNQHDFFISKDRIGEVGSLGESGL